MLVALHMYGPSYNTFYLAKNGAFYWFSFANKLLIQRWFFRQVECGLSKVRAQT